MCRWRGDDTIEELFWQDDDEDDDEEDNGRGGARLVLVLVLFTFESVDLRDPGPRRLNWNGVENRLAVVTLEAEDSDPEAANAAVLVDDDDESDPRWLLRCDPEVEGKAASMVLARSR